MEQLQPQQKTEIALPTLPMGLLNKETPLSELHFIEAKRKQKADVVYENIMAIWSVIWAISASASRLRRAALAAKRSGKARSPPKK